MIYATLKYGCLYATAPGLWQYDYGQVLRIQGMDLPTAAEIHFSLRETGGESATRVGVTKDGVTDVVIPDSMLENNGAAMDYKIYAFIYLTDESSGETVRKITMPVRSRPKPEAFDRPEDAELFREAIAAVNAAAERAEAAADYVSGEGVANAKAEIDRYVTEKEEALKGVDGETPYIGENGNWFIGETDTGKPAGAKADWAQENPDAPDYIKNKPDIPTEEDIMAMLTEAGVIEPLYADANTVYTDNNGAVYIL